jgi:hypothetical protein
MNRPYATSIRIAFFELIGFSLKACTETIRIPKKGEFFREAFPASRLFAGARRSAINRCKKTSRIDRSRGIQPNKPVEKQLPILAITSGSKSSQRSFMEASRIANADP